MKYVSLVPAYERDYTNKKAVMDDWKAGKDFQIAGWDPDAGRYISAREAEPGVVYNIRYKKLTMVVSVRRIEEAMADV